MNEKKRSCNHNKNQPKETTKKTIKIGKQIVESDKKKTASRLITTNANDDINKIEWN